MPAKKTEKAIWKAAGDGMIVETGSDELEHISQPVPWATNKRAKDRIGKNRIG